MDALTAVAALGGVARTPTLAARGVSRHHLEREIKAGRLTRVRRGWVALSRADPYLVAAARAGVVLTCVTQSRRLGLWVLEEDRPHVAASAHAGGVAGTDVTVHWARPAVPRHPDALVDPIENALALVAACQPFEAALAVWESALRKGIVEREVLARLPLSAAARRVLDAATPFADSGLETIVVTRLRWLRLPIRAQIWIAEHRVDFLIGDRLALQIDGAHHVGAQRQSDIEHDARLTLLGYHVIRVGYWQVVDRWHEVQDLIMHAVAQGLHR